MRSRSPATSTMSRQPRWPTTHGRFGAFASLPMTDLDESLAEIERSLDGLGLDGVNLLTNVDGVYLGDASLEPIMAELDRRQAVVFIHPTSPACWECTSLGFPRPMIEFPFDTTRAVTNLLLTGHARPHPAIRWIVPHAGGTLPFLAPRIAGVGMLLGFDDPAAIVAQLRALHYDLAGSANDVGRVGAADARGPLPDPVRQRLAVHARAGRGRLGSVGFRVPQTPFHLPS